MRRVTFSRNYTLSLSRTCRCYCKYCAFATHQAHLYEPPQVESRLDEAVRRNAKELLVLTGERPEVHPEVAALLRSWGHPDFVSYVAWVCERALDRGLLPHTNLGVLEPADLARLRETTASQGLMLESISERLDKTMVFLDSVKPDLFTGAGKRTIELKFRSVNGAMSGHTYVTQVLMPDFYFHVATAHAILRNNGANIGKADYLGKPDYLN